MAPKMIQPLLLDNPSDRHIVGGRPQIGFIFAKYSDSTWAPNASKSFGVSSSLMQYEAIFREQFWIQFVLDFNQVCARSGATHAAPAPCCPPAPGLDTPVPSRLCFDDKRKAVPTSKWWTSALRPHAPTAFLEAEGHHPLMVMVVVAAAAAAAVVVLVVVVLFVSSPVASQSAISSSSPNRSLWIPEIRLGQKGGGCSQLFRSSQPPHVF